MPRMLHRLVVFLLLPCLIADPSFTIAATQNKQTNKQTNAQHLDDNRLDGFQEQAIVEPTFTSREIEPVQTAHMAEVAARQSMNGQHAVVNEPRLGSPILNATQTPFEMARGAAAENQSQLHLADTIAKYGEISESDPWNLYLRELLIHKAKVPAEKLPRIVILGNKGQGVNAWVYPNGTVVLTPELLEFVDSEEELLFVLFHEFMHYERKHFAKMENKVQQNAFVQALGLSRYHEYEADVAAFLVLSDRGVNSQGGIQFFNKLRARKTQTLIRWRRDEHEESGWGAVHGSSVDRLLNVGTVTYLKDLDALSHVLTPIPAPLKDSLKSMDANLPTLARLKEGPLSTRLAIAAEASWELLPSAMVETYKRWANLRSQGTLEYDEKNELRQEQQVLDVLVQRFRQLLGSALHANDPVFNGLETYVLLTIFMGVPLEAQIDQHQKNPTYVMKDLSGAAKVFVSHAGEGHFLIDLAEALEHPALQAIPVNFDTGRLRQLGSLALRIGIHEGGFDDDEGNFNYRKSIEDLQRLVRAAKNLAEHSGSHTLDQTDMIWDWLKPLFQEFRDRGLIEDPHALNDFLSRLDALLRDLYPPTVLPVERANLLLMAGGAKDDQELVKRAMHRLGLLQSGLEKPNSPAVRAIVDSALAEKGGYRRGASASVRDFIEAGIYLHQLSLSEDFDIHVWAGAIIEDFKASPLEHGELTNAISFIQLFSDYPTANVSDYLRNYYDAYYDEDEEIPSLTELASLADHIQHPEKAEAEFQQARLYVGTPEDITTMAPFKALLFKSLAKDLKSTSDADAFFNHLDDFLRKWPLFKASDLVGLFGKLSDDVADSFQVVLQKGWDLAQKTADTRIKRERQYVLSFFILDSQIQTHVQNYLTLELCRQMSFSEALDLLFSRYPRNSTLGVAQALEYLIEEKAKTPEDFEVVKSHVQEAYSGNNEDTAQMFGNLVEADAFVKQIFRNQSRLLRILLGTGYSDRDLREFLFTLWYPAYARKVDLGNVPDQMESLDRWETAMPRTVYDGVEHEFKYYPCEVFVQAFLRMNAGQKYAFLRDALMGDSGVLRNRAAQRTFMNDFLSNAMESSDGGQTGRVVRDVFGALVEAASDERLYFALNPLLMDRLANPPLKPSPWKEIPALRDRAAQELQHVRDTYLEELLQKMEANPERAEQASINRLTHWAQGYVGNRPTQDVVAEEFLSIVPPEFYQKKTERLSPIGFALEMAKNLGAPGVRFLQLLGQFVEIPAEYQKAFSAVYDQMKGQSRLAAYETVKREDPEYFSQIAEWGPRLGGGSEFTVYKVTLKDGTVEVLKVLNPNVEYHKSSTLEVMEKGLQALAKRNPDYEQAEPLLHDLDEWIEGDTHDVSFAQDDEAFRKRYDGYRPKGFEDSVYIPKTRPTKSSKIFREEYIEGRNMTEENGLSVAEKKQQASLLVKFYFSQIEGRTLAGIPLEGTVSVLSDVHKGNVRVMKDGRLAILDRLFYLKMDLNDRLMLKRIRDAKDLHAQLEAFIQYLQGLPENEGHRQEIPNERERRDFREHLIQNILAQAHSGDSLEKAVAQAMVKIRHSGLKIPLRISLLIKNLNSLYQIARDAGFQSLEEASEFKPKPGLWGLHEGFFMATMRFMPWTLATTVATSLFFGRALQRSANLLDLSLVMVSALTVFLAEQGWLQPFWKRLSHIRRPLERSVYKSA